MKIPNAGRIHLVAYYPMDYNAIGMQAVKLYGQLPFIDGSCRREPDFENKFPSITSLCRGTAFVSRLKVKDIVVYVTAKHDYLNTGIREQHITAVLQVKDWFKDHITASNSIYYARNNILPVNCMVAGNHPKSFLESCYRFPGSKDPSGDAQRFVGKSQAAQVAIGNNYLKAWDASYQQRARKYGRFVVTESLYLNLTSPPAKKVSSTSLDDKFKKIFTLPELNSVEFNTLMQQCSINLSV